MRKIYSLQGLRAVAFICIFLGHCGIGSGGSMGVSVFLIMSGFLMTYNYWNRELSLGLKRSILFSINKIRKLYPLHLVMILPMLTLNVYGAVRGGSFWGIGGILRCILQLLANLFLIQAWIPIREFYFSFNGVAWYLSVCVLLYFAFPYLHNWMKAKFKLHTAIWIILTIYVAQITFSFLASTSVGTVIVYNNLWFTYIFPLFRLGDFLTGCCMGYIFLQDIGQNVSLCKATIIEVLAFIMMAVTYLIGLYSNLSECMLSVIYLPVSAIVVYAIALNSGLVSGVLSKKLFVEIGNISAYTFLIHQVIINLMEIIGFHRLNIVVGCFVISIILAHGYRRILNWKVINFPSKMGESSIPIAWQKNSAQKEV